MTTYRVQRVTCPLCGATSEHVLLQSTIVFGASDLDTRPAPLERSTLGDELCECRRCGLVWPAEEPELGRSDGVRDVVESELYRSLASDVEATRVANRYWRLAVIDYAALNDPGAAGWAMLHAAWACDDAQLAAAAAACRLAAARHFEAALEEAGPGFEQPGADEALLADVLRCAGRFADALAWVQRGLRREPEPFLRSVLEQIARHARELDPAPRQIELDDPE